MPQAGWIHEVPGRNAFGGRQVACLHTPKSEDTEQNKFLFSQTLETLHQRQEVFNRVGFVGALAGRSVRSKNLTLFVLHRVSIDR